MGEDVDDERLAKEIAKEIKREKEKEKGKEKSGDREDEDDEEEEEVDRDDSDAESDEEGGDVGKKRKGRHAMVGLNSSQIIFRAASDLEQRQWMDAIHKATKIQPRVKNGNE